MSGPELKQRLAAIFAADVAGYSRLMAANERATVAALDAARAVFRAQIEANHGRVIDMAGDSVLAVFETANGAVATALAVQAEVNLAAGAAPEERRMLFRIGVHLGDVIEKADGTVYGDGVNIAARLEGLAEPGGITVSESVHTAVRGRVPAGFEDQGEQAVKNITHPVRAYRLRLEGKVPGPQKLPLVGGEIDLPLPDKPSVAVLPFTNMSGDPEQEYFTDGITEDIITELSRFQSLFVIARNSSFTYKGKAVDAKQISRELGVRYVVEGSIRKAANRIRVTAQLIDTLGGSHIWAEKYDRVLEDIFAVQEEVTECIVGAIAPRVDAAEYLRVRRRPGNLSAYELAVRAVALAVESQQKSDVAMRNEALRLAREALGLDAESVLALTAIADVQWLNVAFHTADDRHAAWQEGMDAAMRGIAIAQSTGCHVYKAFLLAYAPGGGRWDEARIEAELAWRGNPQDWLALAGCGFILAITGDPVEGICLLERLMRINPRDPNASFTYANLASAHLATRDYAKGIDWALRATNAAPEFAFAFMITAALYVGLSDIDQAKSSLERARLLAPEGFHFFSRAQRPDPRKPAQGGSDFRRRFHTFLRIAAGLEDPSAADALR
ncbi:MAG: adenylate/guanylate cyclase domain-containing protein [Burkholderiaceae bacterium]